MRVGTVPGLGAVPSTVNSALRCPWPAFKRERPVALRATLSVSPWVEASEWSAPQMTALRACRLLPFPVVSFALSVSLPLQRASTVHASRLVDALRTAVHAVELYPAEGYFSGFFFGDHLHF